MKRQCDLLGINRSSAYYQPAQKEIDETTLEIMNKIDQIHTDNPTFGYRKMTDVLRRDYVINRKRVQRLM